MAGPAFRTHRPPWTPPALVPFLLVGVLVGGGVAAAFLEGAAAVDPVDIYLDRPEAVRILRVTGWLGYATGGLAGALLGGLVWAGVAVVSRRRYHQE